MASPAEILMRFKQYNAAQKETGRSRADQLAALITRPVAMGAMEGTQSAIDKRRQQLLLAQQGWQAEQRLKTQQLFEEKENEKERIFRGGLAMLSSMKEKADTPLQKWKNKIAEKAMKGEALSPMEQKVVGGYIEPPSPGQPTSDVKNLTAEFAAKFGKTSMNDLTPQQQMAGFRWVSQKLSEKRSAEMRATLANIPGSPERMGEARDRARMSITNATLLWKLKQSDPLTAISALAELASPFAGMPANVKEIAKTRIKEALDKQDSDEANAIVDEYIRELARQAFDAGDKETAKLIRAMVGRAPEEK